MKRSSRPRLLVLGFWLALVLVSPAAGVAQSLFPIHPDSAGPLLGGDTALEGDTFGDAETDSDVTDESLEMRMRYPELYDSGLTPDLERSVTPEDAEADMDETLETQARYPEIYLENRLYDEDDLLSIDRKE